MWNDLFGAFVCCAALMFLLWLLHFPLRNAAIVDAGWSLGIPLCTAYYTLVAAVPGWPERQSFLLAMTLLWGLRLGGYLLFTRVVGHAEEGRYTALRMKWKTGLGVKFLVFFETQAFLSALLSLPLYLAAANPRTGFSPLEWIGAGLWLAGWVGESASDWQLWRFKSSPANKGKTCREGLWRYSRHPNYFFELLVWIGWGTFSAAAPGGGSWGLLSPAILLYFLIYVTGIRPTEEQALRTKGDDYRNYQQTTSAFIPWFPKSVNDTFHKTHKNS